MSIRGEPCRRLSSGVIIYIKISEDGDRFVLWLVLRIVGAVAGAYVPATLGAAAVTRLDLCRVLVIGASAITVLPLYHALRGVSQSSAGGAPTDRLGKPMRSAAKSDR